MKVDLTIQEWNVVINALAGRPYAEVMDLIPKIREQVAKQVDDKPEEQ